MELIGTNRIESERLILRRFEIVDAEELFAGYINQPEFLYYANKEPQTLDGVKSYLNHVTQKYNDGEYFNWVITQREDGKIVGAINLKPNHEDDSVMFSYAIDNRFTGKGYMTEALTKVKEYALDKLKVSRFVGGCVTKNIASKKVMEKCGLKHEKTIKNYKTLSDGVFDMFFYSVSPNKKQ